jgi:hypothetical protein
MARFVKGRNAPSLTNSSDFNALKEKVTTVEAWTQGNMLTETQQDSMFNIFAAKAENFDQTILGRVTKLEESDIDIKASVETQKGRIDNVKASIDSITVDISDLQLDVKEADANFEKLGMTAVAGN